MKKHMTALALMFSSIGLLFSNDFGVDIHYFEIKGKSESLSRTLLNIKEIYEKQTDQQLYIYLPPELTVEELRGGMDLSLKNLDLDKCLAYICKSYNLAYYKVGEVYFIHPPGSKQNIRNKIQPAGSGQPM